MKNEFIEILSLDELHAISSGTTFAYDVGYLFGKLGKWIKEYVNEYPDIWYQS